ncbi:malto-oligosyltrehalose trehalohydrolase [Cnuibacter physcomitrellae]|uniref:malto-oligosyltrehalose trehalohydrolase n=1 Tax=Cnuibacter physcomitrellae TaxID=1619308 RepID=UPI00217582DE|nr:malto-oligosyltrehalose trehalohydrolase [Cnuibacter physcomitrellae]MCS5499085.1 malto-oligosyltrehalose trehalohydrolase [Cnuibacter physcomitrellae]
MLRCDYDVWAPRASTVSIVLDGETHEMTPAGDGWWTTDVPWRGGVDYGYLLDGEGPLPDPRSRRQPSGVHGLSRTDDPRGFEWHDAGFRPVPLADAEIYELHIGTFTPEGTLEAAATRFDHLRSIGVTHIELLPVNDFNGEYNWGYDGVDWYAVHELYGGPEGYRRFVDAAHQAGLAVIQDVVYNHLGPSGNYLPMFGPYLHDASANTWGASINLDGEGSTEVRSYIIDNALMWLDDYRVDGLRLDAVHALVDHGPVHLLAELSAAVDEFAQSEGRSVSLIAESDLNDPVMFTERSEGGHGLTGQWSDDFHHAVHVNLTGETIGYYADFESVGALAKVLTKGFYHDGTYSSFRERDHGVPIDRENTATWRLVVANQNHDQIGNRAIGDRLTATLDADRLAIAAALTMLGPFTPMLFMGEEWSATTPWQFFTSHPEPELGEATAKGRIAEFAKMGWDESSVPDPQDPATFERSKLDWSEPAQPEHARMLALYQRLAELRPDLVELTFDDVAVAYDEDARWLVLDRAPYVLVVNLSDSPVDVTAVAPQAGEPLLDTAAFLRSAPLAPESLGAPHSVVVARRA